MASKVKSALLLAWSAAALARLATVVELNAETFRSTVLSDENDVLVLFYSPSCPGCDTAGRVLDGVAAKLNLTHASGIQLAMYNTAAFGVPAGLHLHDGDEPAVFLFPAGGRDTERYDWRADDTSFDVDFDGSVAQADVAASGSVHAHVHDDTCQHHGHDHDHGHDHAHDHAHPSGRQPRLTVVGVLRFLAAHSTFPGEVPAGVQKVPLATRWAGREGELFAAVGNGLAALQARLDALLRDNEHLRKDNAALQAKLSACACS